MKTIIVLALLTSCFSLFALEDFEQLWVFDNPMQSEFLVNALYPTIYHYHASVNGTMFIQNLPAEEWLYGWYKGSLEEDGYVGFTRPAIDPLVNPVFCAVEPQIYAATPLTDDPLNDHLFNNTQLDIMEYRATYTSERLYLAMKTASPDYNTSSGMTYFAYMPVIVNPDANMEDDPIVYGLMYTVDLPPLISPGLYKISGSGFNGLSRLGDIELNIEEGFLMLSCNIADLLADPDFASWYDPDYPVFATTATTSRITLVNGIQQADMSPGVKVLLKPHYIQAQNLSSPVLSNPNFVVIGDVLFASIDYSDADANVPDLATVAIDAAEAHPLMPQSTANLVYSTIVTYASEPIPISPTWEQLTFTFSDGSSSVTHILNNPGSSTPQDTQVPLARLLVYPNPASNTLFVKVPPSAVKELAVYNLKGQKLADFSWNGEAATSDISGLASGIYFLKGAGFKSSRFVKY